MEAWRDETPTALGDGSGSNSGSNALRGAAVPERRAPAASAYTAGTADPGNADGGARPDTLCAPRTPRIPRTLVAVLAAGRSARMGFPKLLAPYKADGQTTCLLRRAVLAARTSSADEVAVVLGAYGAQARAELGAWETQDSPRPTGCRKQAREDGTDVPLVLLDNDAWETGQASSVGCAARFAEERGFDALVVMAADQPFVEARHLDALIAAFRDAGERDGAVQEAPHALRACSAGRLGNPCLFPRAAFPLLKNLSGDEGARQLFRGGALTGVPVDVEADGNPAAASKVTGMPRTAHLFFDVDTPAAFERLRELARRHGNR